MRKLRLLSLVVLLISVSYFALYKFHTWRTYDAEGPVITMEEQELHVKVADGDEVLLQGVTAADEKDGDVTSSIVIESISDFVEPGVRYVNYAAFDGNNHVAKASRKVIYEDYEPIRFAIAAPLRFAASSASAKEMLTYVHAYDCVDGDISGKITFSEDSSVSISTPGEYSVKLVVRNSAGDEAVLPVTITIYTNAEETASPKIELTEYLVYTPVGSSIDPLSYIANPVEDLQRYSITGGVDYQTPGTYEIEYQLEANGHVGSVHLVVVVEEA